ncbi:hypothetical protein QAD02_000444 [Eretmocerus hayati]|uniref:Uncharacterized protein n=1 Tax=Eretmocerus hayati TaxID=131215 RepID=A0ACC2NDF7_9HYME|nr:hypothetical protein QAD02_000444 [Eretmocerus hayati]
MSEAMLQFLCQLFPSLRENLKGGTLDFKIAVINALGIVFPTIRVVACLFHYKQAILKRWKKLRLPINDGTELLGICWAMAYLPAIMWPQGMLMVTAAANELQIRYPAAVLMYDYWNHVWPRLANGTSVFGAPIRTTNECETFNKVAHGLFGDHPPMFTYLDEFCRNTMKGQMEEVGREYLAITRNTAVYSVRSHTEMQADVNLLRRQVFLYLGRESVEDFLEFCINQRRLQHFPDKSAQLK